MNINKNVNININMTSQYIIQHLFLTINHFTVTNIKSILGSKTNTELKEHPFISIVKPKVSFARLIIIDHDIHYII